MLSIVKGLTEGVDFVFCEACRLGVIKRHPNESIKQFQLRVDKNPNCNSHYERESHHPHTKR